MSIAIVTGASSGIGREIALQLGRESQLEIWLIARRADRLEALKAEIEKSGGHAICISLDLVSPDSVQALKARLIESGRKVSWLVNNAGFGFTGDFLEETSEGIRDMIALNVTTLTLLCREIVPLMENDSKIINIASSVAFAPMPGYTVYAATKSYVLHFSIALGEELRSRGIAVTAVCPGPVATEFFDVAQKDGGKADRRLPSIIFENPRETASQAIRAARRSQSVIATGSMAKAFRAMTSLVPKSLFASISAKTARD